MAETILIPVAKEILGKLGSLALDQIALAWSLRNELEKLKGTVYTIQAVLRDAEEKQGHNRQVKLWLEKLSDVMYDADDLLDDFSTETRRERAARADTTTTTCWTVVCFIVSFPKRFLYENEMAHAIRAIREKLDDIKNDREFHLEELAEEQAVPLETDPCPPMIVVGREADRAEIVRHLVHSDGEEANVSVVPIVGMGGLGKTTVAQLVFDDEAVKACFGVRVWVYVSQSFDVKGILEKMLQYMTGESQAGLQLAVLQEKLREKMRAKRFLVVMDDVLEENARGWEDLAKYLMVGAIGSKVLVTTRSSKVAEVGSGIMKSETGGTMLMPYYLGGLSPDESWDLLVRKALHGEVQQSLDVERTGREILKKCCGVPLAISTIAGLLRSKDPKTDWLLFLDAELSNISEGENHIMSTLRLSFNHLPTKLKHCFSYCKLFKKGDALDVQRLVHLWMAQGLVESEDEGLDCFKTLCWRSFFQEVKVNQWDNALEYRTHDLMHNLADSIVGQKIVRGFSSSILQRVSPKTRHMAVLYDHSFYDDDQWGDVSKVRTLIGYGSFFREDCQRTLQNFKRLRALQMDKALPVGNPWKELQALGDLKHLRFLGLSSWGIKRVPNSITKLINLQVLDLSGCHYIEELPRDVRKLVDLKHIYLHWNVKLTHMPKGIGELTSLQTLPVFAVGHKGDETTANGAAGLDELRGLNLLRGELKITNLLHAKPVSSYVLKNKLFLQSLVLEWRYDDDDDATHSAKDEEEVLEMLGPHPHLTELEICKYTGVILPNWLSTITNLVELTIRHCRECEYLPPLHQLPSLKKLSIRWCEKLKGIRDEDQYQYEQPGTSVSDADAEDNKDCPHFPTLSSLKISSCPSLCRMPLFPTIEAELELHQCSARPLIRTMMMKSSRLSRPPLSQVSSLQLDQIDDLEYLPKEGLRNLTSLQVLEISNCPQLANLSSLCNLTSLQVLVIMNCPRLATLPPANHLTSMENLSIKGCPMLKERCREGEDEEWPSIIDIPSPSPEIRYRRSPLGF